MRRALWIILVVPALVLAGCGSDSKDAKSSATTTVASTPANSNACPVDGCKITVVDATKDGAELRLTFETNYTPDIAKNHIHVYWDKYTAQQVSDNAQTKYGVTQGDWVPTDVTKQFLTEGAVSVAARGTSKTVCVTAGDRDHNVLAPDIVDCRDVSSLL